MDELDPEVFEHNKKMMRGVELKNMGMYDAALKLYHEALSFYDRNSLGKHAAEAKHAIAIVYRRMERYQAAREQLDALLEYYENEFDDYGKAKSLAELAYLDEFDGNYEAAIDKNREALEIYEEFEDHRGVVIVHDTLCNLYLVTDDPDKVLPWRHCLKSIRVARENGFDNMLPRLMERLDEVKMKINPRLHSTVVDRVMKMDDLRDFLRSNMDLIG